MTAPVAINNFDPNQILTGPARPLSGPVQTGTVTYDVDYTDTSGNGIFARWIYIGTTGNLAYLKYDNTTELLPNIAAGVWHPIPSKRILITNTTIAANQLRWGA